MSPERITKRAVFLDQDEIPTSWYNIQADLPEPLPPPLDPSTLKPLSSPEPLFRLFAKELSPRKSPLRDGSRYLKRFSRPTGGFQGLPPLCEHIDSKNILERQQGSTTSGKE